jgi:hypothetical protein
LKIQFCCISEISAEALFTAAEEERKAKDALAEAAKQVCFLYKFILLFGFYELISIVISTESGR